MNNKSNIKKIVLVFIIIIAFGGIIYLVNNKCNRPKINVYFFWGNGCPHCEQTKKFFDSIENTYGKYYNLVDFEVWENEGNAEIMEEVGETLNEEADGVPYLVIGNKSFIGFSDEIGIEIKQEIKKQYKSDDYVDIVKPIIDK